MTKRAAQSDITPRPFYAFERKTEENAGDVFITHSTGPTLHPRQPVIDPDLIVLDAAPATASRAMAPSPPEVQPRTETLPASASQPARSLMDALLQAQDSAQQVRASLALQFKKFQENFPLELIKNFMPVLTQARGGPADLRRLLRQLHNLGLIDRVSLLVKSTLIRSLPEELRIRLASVEWQILRDEILELSDVSENLTSCWQSARALLAKRWHLDFLKEAIWNTANEAFSFIPPANRQFPAWAQREWAIQDSPANASLLAVLAAAPAGMSKVSLELGHLDERTRNTLIRCASLRQLELMQEAPADQTQQSDLSWLDKLTALDSLVLGKNVQLASIPPLTRSRLQCLSLATADAGAPLEILIGLSRLQALHLKLDIPAAQGLPAGLHTLLLEAGRQASEPENKLLQSLTALEIEGSHFDLRGLLDRLPNLESLTLQDSATSLDALTSVLASPACKLRGLRINNLSREGKAASFLGPLKSGHALRQLSLSTIYSRTGVNLLLEIIHALSDLSELSLSFSPQVTLLKESAVGRLLESIDKHPGLSKLALHFEVSSYDEEAGERLNTELAAFRKKNKSLTEFTCTINETSLSHYNWKY